MVVKPIINLSDCKLIVVKNHLLGKIDFKSLNHSNIVSPNRSLWKQSPAMSNFYRIDFCDRHPKKHDKKSQKYIKSHNYKRLPSHVKTNRWVIILYCRYDQTKCIEYSNQFTSKYHSSIKWSSQCIKVILHITYIYR